VTYPAEALQAALGDRYVLDRQIGRGGMAVVYLADDQRYHRRVAVKVLRPELAASLAVDRFLREIQTAARLQHPNILPVYDSGGADGILYYVMPFVEGESLRARLVREHRLPLADVLRIAEEVGGALAFAHRQNVVHRDTKPENILLYGGRATVVDFGIAKAVLDAGDEKLTQLGTGIGTPAYMSPEQAFGHDELDGRSDQYSLACTLYELLVGELPFSGNTALAIMAEKATRPPPGMRTARGTVPGPLEAAIHRALSRAPDDRFPTMDAFLDAILRGGSVGERGRADPRARESDPGWSIAVLPFLNLTSDPENEYLSDGISEELIHALAKVKGLRVVARTSAFAFKGKQQDVRSIGRELQVRAVLEGSVRLAGRRLRVTSQLIDTANGFELWSERYDRELTDVFEVQDEISRAIVGTLRVTLLGDQTQLVRPPTEDLAAYEAYLRGRFHWNLRTEAGLLASVSALGQAIALDPDFALAHAALAESYATMGIYGVLPPSEAMPRALASAERALAVDPTSGEALTARASVRALFHWDGAAAESDYLAAAAAAPQYPNAHHWFAMHLLAPQRRFDEARARLTRARELDPLSPAIAAGTGLIEYFEGRTEEAVASYRALLQRDAGFGLGHYFLGQALTALARYEDAIRSLETALTLTAQSPEVESALGLAHGLAGDAARAGTILDRLVARARERYISPVLLAQVQLGLGRRDAALASLEEAVRLRATELTVLEVKPVFAELRGDTRFERLLVPVRGATTPAA
jgi:eukaryotic-like serine/threonine-protein kinase